jgi:hypothetical protein
MKLLDKAAAYNAVLLLSRAENNRENAGGKDQKRPEEKPS